MTMLPYGTDRKVKEKSGVGGGGVVELGSLMGGGREHLEMRWIEKT